MNVSPHLWAPNKSADYQFDDSAMRLERAVSEFRYGRPIVLSGPEGSVAALALDAASPSDFERFARAAGDQHALYLSRHRAARLGLSNADDIAIPARDMDFASASALAYARDSAAQIEWKPATSLMRTAGEVAGLALLLPAMMCVEVPRHARTFAACVEVDHLDLPKSRRMARNFEVVVRTPVPLRDLGDCEFVVFRGGVAQKDQVAIVVGQPDTSGPVPVRIHSSCLTGDLCGSLKCDCGDQLRNGLSSLKEQGGGVLLYLDQEGRGTGIGAKMRAYGYQHEGLDTIDADAELGFGPDERRYDAAVAMLGGLGIGAVNLLTNNPTKVAALLAAGIAVNGRTSVTGRITPDNLEYLRTKTLRAGHALDIDLLTRAATELSDG
ncbi:MAG: GTP cyclohydrolase II RibA [Alphaproteobacteria bacterium]|nr:GTP cyclohydrolase II RibA [Alphaproteobacteria bacterium]MBU1548116.1 GTP cyclohydrolase II RibA [Alphaproteobacteria bacterium]MBU2336122.1 GTP cyclohydrolase II RibA [Alphaproteobacteria bacterium]MBU2390483.1 GTP cyclohydrolase II RibA [Alphaproteobacteria bacterium]